MLSFVNTEIDTVILFCVRLLVPVAALFAAFEYSQTTHIGPPGWHVVPSRVTWAVVFASVANMTLAVGIIFGWWSAFDSLIVTSMYGTSFAATIFGGAVIAKMQRHYIIHIRRVQESEIRVLTERLEMIGDQLAA